MNGSGPVGDILRRQREAHGISIEEIAAILRIRPAFLDALEQGRHEQLPGSTYAIGFVRTYAEHLGLDGIEMVNQFKREAAGLDRRTTLSFPSPAPDGRVPGFWPLAIALIAAVLIAGAWYVLRGDVADLAPRVAAVPERLSPPPLLDPASPAEPAPAESSSAAVSPPFAAAPAEPVPTSPPLPPPSASPSATNALPPPDLPAPPSSAPPANSATAALPAVRPESGTAAPPSPPAPSAAALLASPNVPAEAASAGDGRVFGAQNEAARVVIRARGESWVQIRDASNQALLTRTLRAGDTYRVPMQPGLTMMTGNAGVLDVFVDGVQAAPLGPVGLVKRNISLDPERLRSAP